MQQLEDLATLRGGKNRAHARPAQGCLGVGGRSPTGQGTAEQSGPLLAAPFKQDDRIVHH